MILGREGKTYWENRPKKGSHKMDLNGGSADVIREWIPRLELFKSLEYPENLREAAEEAIEALKDKI